MEPVAAVMAVIFGGIALTVGIVAVTIIILVNGRRSSMLSQDESRLMQEMHHGFVKMEQRIETLETLLLEREMKGKQR